MTTVQDVMAKNVQTVSSDSTLTEAARLMRDHDIGDVVVLDNDQVRGILTDRDVTVRAVAEGQDPNSVQVSQVCTADPATVSPTDDLQQAATLMREKAVRRLPVVENGMPVGVISIGDLAIELDERSALADISAASPNNT